LPIIRLLQNRAFAPEDIAILTAVFEDTLRELGLVDRNDPATETVARKVIEMAQRGERDPIRLRRLVLDSLRDPS
jgi:hypothetical protein